MAKNTDSGVDNKEATLKQEEPVPVKTAKEPQYGITELMSAARLRFNVPPEVVGVALKIAGKEKATFTEAQAIIKTFLERKVN